MTDPVFGYLQIVRTSGQLAAIEARMREVAAILQADITNRIYHEAPPPAARLWSLLDHTARHFDQDLPGMVRSTARQNRVDLSQILSTPAPSVALWRLIAAIRSTQRSKVLIPSLDHLGGFGIEPEVIVQLMSSLGAQVMWLEYGTALAGRRPRPQPTPPGPQPGLIIEHRISPFGLAVSPAQDAAAEALRHVGLADMVDVVSAVLAEIVGDIEKHWRGRAEALSERAFIRLSVPPTADMLLVEIDEPRDITTTPITAGLRSACSGHEHTLTRSRALSGSGTITRCALKLRSRNTIAVADDRLAAAVRQFEDLRVGRR